MKDLEILDLMAGLPLEDGQAWGSVAETFQIHDASAVLEGPARRSFILRGRGMSKTTDIAALAVTLLLTEAPSRSMSYVYAADVEQADLTMQAIAGFVQRANLSGQLKVSARSVTHRETGATLTVETSDGASAFGKRPWLQIVDELGMWPDTANHRNLWAAITSAIPKVPGSRLVVISTAGSPTGLGARVWEEAEKSRYWTTSKSPGPSPWWSEEDIEATKTALSESEWSRLILCEWAEADDALTTPEDVEAAIRSGNAVLEPEPHRRYVAALDVGTRKDLTALVVGHSEQRESGRVSVIDRILYWRPKDHGGRVDLAEVEAAALRECTRYGAKLIFDRMQAEQLVTNLERKGIRTEEFVFSQAGANRLARTLWGALRDRTLELPDEEEIRSQFQTVRLVETGPATVKLENPPGTHDDIPTAVGMLLTELTSSAPVGRVSISVPQGTRQLYRPSPVSALRRDHRETRAGAMRTMQSRT